MKSEKADIIFCASIKQIKVELEIPLHISANELVLALNDAYQLGIRTNDVKNCYFQSESPVALLKGNKKLSEFGVRNGTIIYYVE